MMNKKHSISKKSWLVPEVVQTSMMDCGPAALKCLLEGFKIPVSFGRLREVCQTNVDGTSIDMLEEVANRLGLDAEQVMIPLDHIFLSEAAVLPAMVVVKHADGTTHFVVIWRRHGAWLQVMDPAIGRRWVTCQRFSEEIFRHSLTVSATEWSAWAASDEFLKPLYQRMSMLGVTQTIRTTLITQALESDDWFGLATLDAGIRLVDSFVEAKGIKAGKQASRLLKTVIQKIDKKDIYKTIPVSYWSVMPSTSKADSENKIQIKGAVLLQVKAKKNDSVKVSLEDDSLAIELDAALNEKTSHPIKTILSLLKADGFLSPIALVGALTIAAAAVLLETLLFRGIFDIVWELKLSSQRLWAVVGLMTFVSLLLLIEIPIAMESLRFGRHLETRLRMALLRKMPKLTDRYFQSRPVSDMAERSHSIALTRSVPSLGIQFVQTLWDIIFTLTGIILIAPASSGLAFIITGLAIILPLLAQPLLNEKDLRIRNHGGALFRFNLDALLGLVPIRTHRAELPVRREHEGLLVEWARSGRNMIQLSLLVEGLQSLICTGFAGLMLYQHFIRSGGVSGGDLLLVFWVLKLPSIGQKLADLAQQYPAQRNTLLRLLEPLSTPEEIDKSSKNQTSSLINTTKNSKAVNIKIADGKVVAAGHSILTDINLTIRAGEHIAIVGSSGAGKSTLVGLLLGWHRLVKGQLRVDGQILSGTTQQALRQETAWVDPAVQLWNRSLLDNLVYSTDDSGFERIATIIDSAALREVLQKLPAGLQTYLGEGGSLLSGGEGQRVRLARALMQNNVRLVLLDEPFRGMDCSQRQKLLNDARKWWHSATMLCVTHDVAETLSFERVLVVENGRIIEDGVPIQLASRDSRYRELLDTEKLVRQKLWKGKVWRRIQVDNQSVQNTVLEEINE